MTLIFNEKQQQAINLVDQFISQYNDKYFYLFGSAGVGKTVIITHIIKNLIQSKKIDYVFICAPTHKALNVLETYFKSNLNLDKQKEFMTKMSFMTIHKLLEFKPVIANEDGSKIFQSTKESKFLKQMEYRLIVIDECSMISSDMIKELDKYIQLYPIKIIFLGDSAQLPPVGEPNSSVFTKIPNNYQFHIILDQIMRTDSMEIKEVSTIIRTWDQKESLIKFLLPIHSRKNSIKRFKMYHKKNDPTKSSWFKCFISKLEINEIPIILTWKNYTADMYNQTIRQYIHRHSPKSNLNNYLKGDYLMFNNFYLSPIDDTNFYTSDMIKILEIKTTKEKLFDWTELLNQKATTLIDRTLNNLFKKLAKLNNHFKVDTLTVERVHSDANMLIDKKTHSIITINLNDLEKYKTFIKTIKEHFEFFFRKYKSETHSAKLWEIFHKKLIDPYAELNMGFAITTHKSQGSNYHIVFADIDDMGTNLNKNEMQKLLYTAVTRASKELYLILN